MVPDRTLESVIEEKQNYNARNILQEIVSFLEKSYSSIDALLGHLTPATILLDDGGKVTALKACQENPNSKDCPDCCVEEWRLADETNGLPRQECDMFSLGCIFAFVLSGGQHPFGKLGQRVIFIQNHLYDLTWCGNEHIRALIRRMINRDAKRRPSFKKLKDFPLLWNDERVKSFLIDQARNIDSSCEHYENWSNTLLFSEPSVANVKENKNNITFNNGFASVAEIMTHIKNNPDECAFLCDIFPDLLPHVLYINYHENFDEEKESSEPDVLNYLLVANKRFNEVVPQFDMKRSHGRLGLQHVHVAQYTIACFNNSSILKSWHDLDHPNLLKCHYVLNQYPQKMILMAYEPFYETLESWKKKKDGTQLEIFTNVFIQITKALTYCHSKKLVNGNLSPKRIAIIEKGKSVLAKVFVSPNDDTVKETYDQKHDVRKLSDIFTCLHGKRLTVCSDHLVKSMGDDNDKYVPPSDTILLHPFFWSTEKTCDFLFTAGDFYIENSTFDNQSCLSIAAGTQSQAKSNREALETFIKTTKNMSASDAEKLAQNWTETYPKLVTETWLKLQKHKLIDHDTFNLRRFYVYAYDFPSYEELGDSKNDCTSDERTSSSNNSEDRLSMQDDGKFPLRPSMKETGVQNQGKLIYSFLNSYLSKMGDFKHGLNLNLPVVGDLGRTALHVACFSDTCLQQAETLLSQLRLDINAKDALNLTPLHIAAWSNSRSIIEMLIENGADVSLKGGHKSSTALHFAVVNNSQDAVKVLLVKGGMNINETDIDGNSPLWIAVAMKYIQIASLLLERGADPNLVNCGGLTPLHAILLVNISNEETSAQLTELLLDHGANPNALGGLERSILQAALLLRSEKVVRILLDHPKIDVNLVSRINGHDLAPLHLAALFDYVDIAKMLIKKNADYLMKDNYDETPLHYAASGNAVRVADILLNKKNVDVNCPGWKNRSPLHVAAARNATNVVKLLILKGANLHSFDELKMTPLHYAQFCKANETTNDLKTHQNQIGKHNIMSNPLTPDDMSILLGAIQIGLRPMNVSIDVQMFRKVGLQWKDQFATPKTTGVPSDIPNNESKVGKLTKKRRIIKLKTKKKHRSQRIGMQLGRSR